MNASLRNCAATFQTAAKSWSLQAIIIGTCLVADKLRALRSREDLLDFWNERYRRYSSMKLTVSAMLARVVR